MLHPQVSHFKEEVQHFSQIFHQGRGATQAKGGGQAPTVFCIERTDKVQAHFSQIFKEEVQLRPPGLSLERSEKVQPPPA